jgi:chemosensory pili system protein ChpB (putative protein-glutamate methylesterase)
MEPPDFTPAEGTPEAGRPAVWVLVGSMGAMAAARRFFDRLPPDHRPLAFVFALRIAPQWAPLVANLLARTTAFDVGVADPRAALHPRELRVVPADGEDAASDSGLEARSVDDILRDVAERYAGDAGAIVLSGIGAEGARGCRAILRHGGRVWTQDFESCRFSSLPRYIQDNCEVSFSAPPEALAARVAER